jgi:hypothetical protein
MKRRRVAPALALLLGWLTLAGCIKTQVAMLDGAYPPSSRVEILKEAPARASKQLAIVSAKGVVTIDELLARLSAKAGGLGADAVILLPVEYQAGLGGRPFPILKGIAIKYE